MWSPPPYDEHGDVTTNQVTPPGPAAPDDGPFLRPRSSWVRAAALLLALVWATAVDLVSGFLAIASYAGGWFYVMLCALPGLVAAARLGGVARWRDTLLVSAAAAFLLGLGMDSSAPPEHGRIRHVAEGVGVSTCRCGPSAPHRQPAVRPWVHRRQDAAAPRPTVR